MDHLSLPALGAAYKPGVFRGALLALSCLVLTTGSAGAQQTAQPLPGATKKAQADARGNSAPSWLLPTRAGDTLTLSWQGMTLQRLPTGHEALRPTLGAGPGLGAIPLPEAGYLPELELTLPAPPARKAIIVTYRGYAPLTDSLEAALVKTALTAGTLPEAPGAASTLEARSTARIIKAGDQARALIELPLYRRQVGAGRFGIERLSRVAWQVQPDRSLASSVSDTRISGAGLRTGATDSARATSSALAQGRWHRIALTETGVYRLTAAELARMGAEVGSLDPRTIKIYGQGGTPLTEVIGTRPPKALAELPIQVTGEGDGRLDPGDAVLFYADGPLWWTYDGPSQQYHHQINVYADTTYLFVTWGGAPGRRLAAVPPAVEAPQRTLTTFTERVAHHRDLVNLGKGGRSWFGETFELALQQDFMFSLPGLVAGAPVRARIGVAASAIGGSATFRAQINGQPVGISQLAPIIDPNRNPFVDRAQVGMIAGEAPAPAAGTPLTVRMIYDRGLAQRGAGYLDYIELLTERQLDASRPVLFRSIAASQVPTWAFVIAGAQQGRHVVWDVTDPTAPLLQPFEAAQGGNGITFTASARAALHEYAAFDPDQLPVPQLAGAVPNQELLDAGRPELIIIAPPGLTAEAERLASHRRRHDGLSVLVTTTRQVYQEFSSGRQDPMALRELARHYYTAEGARLKYVLLFGDATFDYRGRMAGPAHGTVPTYQNGRGDLNIINNWGSDDFVGFMDVGEGGFRSADLLDLGIGRLPVNTRTQAARVIDKLIAYDTDTSSLGNWRTIATFVGDGDDNGAHTADANELADMAERESPVTLSHKIMLPAYPRLAGPSGFTRPAARAEIINRIMAGTLLINYSGHGSELQWSNARVFDGESISMLNNGARLPLFITATCDFGRYDDPSQASNGENLVLRPEGGGLGIISAPRPVYAFSNMDLNRAFYRSVFAPLRDGQMPRLGDVMARTKNNNSSRFANFGYTLLGDPSQRLAYPRHQVAITALEDEAGQPIDTAAALSRVVMRGVVRDHAGNTITGYQGELTATLFDKQTLLPMDESAGPVRVRVRRSVIFNGRAQIREGAFELRFQLPLDIDYSLGQGRLALYARPDRGSLDAAGANQQPLFIGGSTFAEPDNTPPVVRVYINDTTFRSGGRVGPDPVLVVRLHDETGINVSRAGIGRELTATLDSDPRNPIILNETYVTDPGRTNRGTVTYPLRGLAPGRYRVKVRAFDLHNNPGEGFVEFVVGPGDCLALEGLRAWPNPVTGREAHIEFGHTRPGEDLSVRLEVYDVAGRQVGDQQTVLPAAPAYVGGAGGLTWAVADNQGNPLRGGTYLYRLTLQTAQGCRASAVQRLIVVDRLR